MLLDALLVAEGWATISAIWGRKPWPKLPGSPTKPDIVAWKNGWTRIIEVEHSVDRWQLEELEKYARRHRAVLIVAYIRDDFSVDVYQQELDRPESGAWARRPVPPM
jgi:Holliday junction resolvase